MDVGPRLLGRVLLLFWSVWFTVVVASNTVDGLQALGVVGEGLRFTSGNFGLIVESTSIYALPTSLAALFFASIVVVEIGAATLFWRAFIASLKAGPRPANRDILPFVVGVGLFAAFIVADEIFVVYTRFPNLESTHFIMLCALLLSYVAMSVLEDDRAHAGS